MKRVVHIVPYSPIIPSFINFIDTAFSHQKHIFLAIQPHDTFILPPKENLYTFNQINSSINDFTFITKHIYQADQIILHGLFSSRIDRFFFFQPWLLKKTYWVIWGGELYYYTRRIKTFKWNILHFIRSHLIKNVQGLVTYIQGDVELAQKWYNAQGNFFECIMYPSNLYNAYIVPEKHTESTINIQIGNSADPTNNHMEILKRLLPLKDKNIKIYAPLSYGDNQYAQKMEQMGKELFGNKFIPLRQFLPFNEYLAFLSIIDIAIFAHKEQQGMGNTISLLGLGKKVFMRSDTTQWQFFKDKHIEVYDFDTLDINMIDTLTKENNQRNVQMYFSKENYIHQLQNLFER